MKTVGLAILLVGLLAPSVSAQRDPPVSQVYLPRIEIYHEKDAALTVDLLFKSNGGPQEHNERQCYILAYLKRDEKQILKIASKPKLLEKKRPGLGFDAKRAKKQAEKKQLFLDVLLEQKLVVALDTAVAKRTSLVRPQYEGKGSVATSCYPFKFTFKNKALLAAMQKLGNFDRDHVNIVGNQPTWFLDQVKLLVFVPVNDCKYATKISPKLHKTRDFTNRGGLDMLLLYLRPLPYELEFHQRKDDTVFIYVN